MPRLTILDLNLPSRREQVLEGCACSMPTCRYWTPPAGRKSTPRALPRPRRRRPDDQTVSLHELRDAAGLSAASARPGCNCAPGILNWTAWITRPAARGRLIVPRTRNSPSRASAQNGPVCLAGRVARFGVESGAAQTTNIRGCLCELFARKLEDPPPGRLIRTVRGQGYTVPSEAELGLRTCRRASGRGSGPPAIAAS